jgi:hypothetical protein
MELSSHVVGRWADLAPGRTEVKALQSPCDFREPQYRREVFLRFYAFHIKYRTHPGCVYMVIPELAKRLGWNREDTLWFAFINGCTQNPVTSLTIMREFPKVPRSEYSLRCLQRWFDESWAILPFDTDRRYQKVLFPKAVEAYSKWLADQSQSHKWSQSMMDRSREKNFDDSWKVVVNNFVSFGRLSTWSYLEYLFITGMPLEPSSMMLKDMSGSKSHRNGLAIVLGRDDMDWRKDNAFDGKYSKEQLAWLEVECDRLLEEARAKVHGYAYDKVPHVSRFTLESALCTYKGWHRPNRRYPNVYADMFHDRIKQAEKLRPKENFSIFWNIREKSLPTHLLLERTPHDPGLVRQKQNHYRLTGQVVMMDQGWSVFRNDKSWMNAS